MTNYKDTLNLPKTDFPMKGNLAQCEPAMLKHWQEIDLYRQVREKKKGRTKFILHDGPPYANGAIHLGHALNRILKDIVLKSKTLSGFDTPFVPGWDCHGLPIELQVEKKIDKAGVKVSAKEFRKAGRQYAAKQIDRQREDFMRLGALADWDKCYATMDYQYEADIVRSLGQIVKNGNLTKGLKPVYWCTDCGSALAEAEVEYKNKISPQIDMRFRFTDTDEINKLFSVSDNKIVSIIIWTTTPWTLPANQAVAVHPEFNYVLIDDGEERFIVVEDLLETAMQRYGIEDYEVSGKVKGQIMENIMIKHPFYDRSVPIILATHVTTESGTGAVHTAPGHGQDDFVIGNQYNLAIDNPVDGRGVFVESTELLGGLHVNRANNKIIEIMRENGALMLVDKIEHSYPHCWRHKTPIIFRATPQWFIDLEKNNLRNNTLDVIKDVEWLPAWGEARISKMVESRSDWCLSRQRTWGVPITLFVHKESGEIHPDTEALIEQVALRIEQQGIDAWYEMDETELLAEQAAKYEKVDDVMDVWFDSGVSHTAVLKRRDDELRAPPADLYLEGSDQYRGWFQSALLTAVAMYGYAPYKAVLTHGMTVDGEGRKMSKSLDNGIEPQKIFKTLGADILRLWVAATDYSGEMSLSDEILKRMTDAYRRIRNTSRYFLSNLDEFEPLSDSVELDELLELDRWILEHVGQLQLEIVDAYDNYQFHHIYQKIHHFCVVTMGGLYLDILKDRMYTNRKGSLARHSAQTVMYHVVEAFVRWIAPILSFTADEIWRHIPGERSVSVFLEDWYEGVNIVIDPVRNERWLKVINVREEVSKRLETLRIAGEIGSSLDAEVDIYCDGDFKEVLQGLGDELRFVLITSYANVHDVSERSDGAQSSGIEGLCIECVPSSHKKCIRCWHHRKEVGTNTEHPEICDRCVENVTGNGESRKFS